MTCGAQPNQRVKLPAPSSVGLDAIRSGSVIQLPL